MSLPKRHASLELAGDVSTICQPLFTKTDLNYFHFARMYDDGSLSVLVTNPHYHKHFWDKGYNKAFFPNYKEGVFFNEPCATQGLYDAKHFFNIDHMLMLIRRKPGYFEVAGFASHSGNDAILEFYMNNLDLLENFTFYFKDKGNSLIKTAEKNLLLSEGYTPTQDKDKDKNKFFDDFNIKKYEMIDLDNIMTHLTKIEFIVLSSLIKGMTTKEIGKIFNRSNRTIEAHINNIKLKMKCKSKSDLRKVYCKNIKWLRDTTIDFV